MIELYGRLDPQALLQEGKRAASMRGKKRKSEPDLSRREDTREHLGRQETSRLVNRLLNDASP